MSISATSAASFAGTLPIGATLSAGRTREETTAGTTLRATLGTTVQGSRPQTYAR